MPEQKTLLVAGAFCVSLLCSLAMAPDAMAETFAAKVVSVVDGDTINVMHNGAKERVILYGVDSPELGQQFGAEARQFTDDRIYGKVVNVETHGTDPRGRTIAVVFAPDGSNLNQDLVKEGLAWWSDKFAPKDTKLKGMHVAAKTAQRGLWSAPNPIPPWIFRNGEKAVQATIISK